MVETWEKKMGLVPQSHGEAQRGRHGRGRLVLHSDVFFLVDVESGGLEFCLSWAPGAEKDCQSEAAVKSFEA
jgi:hypothetical protein